ncbi:MAG: hypothetical protein JSR17_10160 [Proteobacteria bacterium]|nr:hypothetical protein [Pseudomonadota bacterium]
MSTARSLLFLVSFLVPFLSFAKNVVVPEPLKPWQEWVLFGFEEKLCPVPYNNGEAHYCVWPTSLVLNIDNHQGKFTEKCVNYVQGWVPLPGDADNWPDEVKINDKPVAVLSYQDGPALYLEAGEYTIQGQFTWNELPEALQAPVTLGMLTLTLLGKQVQQVQRDQEGKIWFKERVTQQQQQETDTLSITAYRLFQDGIPLIDNTFLRLKATGKVREVLVGPVLLKHSLPMSLSSPLPAKIEENGMLRIQVKPGVWEVNIKSRFTGKQDSITLETIPSPWPASEIWSFEPQNELRLVEITGAQSMDPQQTDMPQEWKAYPSYLLLQGKSLNLVEKRRGQEKHPSDLSLTRHLWLDFSGKGFIAQDTIVGNVTDNWRLATTVPLALRRATMDGQDKLITELAANETPGIEVRQGHVNLTAVSRIDSKPFSLPAIGWDFDVRSLSTTLYLPPGWKLVGAWGADTVSHAWVQEWTLLDLFLVLIMSAAVAKVLSLGWGLLTLVMMGLIYQEGGAPVYSWLNLVAALALYKVFPQGLMRKLFLYYSRISFVVLILIALPFMVKQIREAIYPQLTIPNESIYAFAQAQEKAQMQSLMALPPSPRAAGAAMGDMAGKGKQMLQGNVMEAKVASGQRPEVEEPPLEEYDPNAKIQTGPGVPTWKWDVSQLVWNGPVLKDQKITLWILPSMVISFLKFLQVGLMFFLFYGLTKIWSKDDKMLGFNPTGKVLISCAGFVLSLLISATLMMPSVVKADMPDKALLEELRARLIRAPDCIPDCGEISRMQIEANENQLTIRSKVQVGANVALPLPASLSKWMPRTVLVDGKEAKAIQLQDSMLWLQLTPGVHDVVIEGPIGSQDKFEVFVPLAPKWVNAVATGYTIEGIFRNKLQGENFYVSRTKAVTQEEAPSIQAGRMPPFVTVKRTLKLGFDWEVAYEITRLAPLSGGIRVEIPLLANEQVLSDNVEVQNKNAIISLGENQDSVLFRSKLKITPDIALQASQDNMMNEIWQLEAISQWHCDFEGLPVIHQQNPQGRYFPTWYPWPGEKLTIHVIKPQAVQGDTLTIDNSHLTVIPGNRATNNTLQFSARSSLGGTHAIKIPANATLQDVQIDGQSQPINAKEGEITLPIHPGSQLVTVKWQLGQGISSHFVTSLVNLNMPSSNALVEMKLSKDRWILGLGGPAIGPAVLFWGVLIIVIVAAFGLSRITALPLNIWQWFLLGVGLSVATPLAALFVIAWFFAMHKRKQISKGCSDISFKAIQIGLGFLSLLFIVSLFTSISSGLLGTPQMQLRAPIGYAQSLMISANNFDLQWYQDIAKNDLPHSWVVSLPLYVYRLLMLLWALWLAFSLIKWLQWGWQCLSTEGLWRKAAKETEATKT